MSSDGCEKVVLPKEEIIGTLIQKAPPGEFNEIYNDVCALLSGDDEALKSRVGKVFVNYHKDHFLSLVTENCDKPAHVTPYNDLSHGRFYHPRNCASFQFDAVNLKAFDWADDDPQSDQFASLQPARRALETAVDKYLSAHFKSGSANVYAVANGQSRDKGDLVVCLVNNQCQPNNFWSGHWRSQWRIEFETDRLANIVGQVTVLIHYFEDGNVQLHSSRPVQRSVLFSDDNHFAQSVVEVIAEEEKACQVTIGESCLRLGDTVFKGLRRQLPVTRSKIDWSKMIKYRVGAELKPM